MPLSMRCPRFSRLMETPRFHMSRLLIPGDVYQRRCRFVVHKRPLPDRFHGDIQFHPGELEIGELEVHGLERREARRVFADFLRRAQHFAFAVDRTIPFAGGEVSISESRWRRTRQSCRQS
jgi:hypothetical protein